MATVVIDGDNGDRQTVSFDLLLSGLFNVNVKN
jgi:hypothetical protein